MHFLVIYFLLLQAHRVDRFKRPIQIMIRLVQINILFHVCNSNTFLNIWHQSLGEKKVSDYPISTHLNTLTYMT